jgi:uncharacterized protein
MPGNIIGGKKTAAKNKARDPEFYSKMGKKGGLAKVPKGFAKNTELASRAGKIGGLKSRRGGNRENQTSQEPQA